jgi:hypothetical protein
MESFATFPPSSIRQKLNHNLPLDLEQLMIATYAMNTLEVGALMRCIMHTWMHGSLPENSEDLFRIMQIDGDASCIASCSALCMALCGGYLKKRSDLAAKHQQRHEICVNAAQVRWEKVRRTKRQNKSESMHASRLPDASPEQKEKGAQKEKPSGSFQVEISLSPPPTPPRRGGGGDTPPTQNERKAKPSPTAHSAVAGSVVDGQAVQSGIDAAYPVRNGGKPGFKNGVNGSKTDPRFRTFQEEFFRFWEMVNPGLGKCNWVGADDKALHVLLARSPDLTLEQFKGILMHRAQSEGIVYTEPPGTWLGGAIKYVETALDRYGKPLERRVF